MKSFYAFDPNFRGGVNVAATSGGWITPAGVGLAIFVASPPVWLEGTIVVGAGVGGAPHVKQFGADTLGLRQSFYAYDFGFRGGVDVAVTQGYFAVKAGTVPDHAADGSPISYPYLTGTMIVTGAGDGGGPHVKVFFHPGTDTPTGLSEVASFNGGTSDGRHGVSVGLRGSEVLTTTRLSDGGVRTESHSFQFAGEQPAILTETPFGNTLANSGTFGSIPKAIQFPPLKVEVTGVAIPVQPEAL